MPAAKKKLTIEILYKDNANYFGELGNMDYINLLFPEADFVYTKLIDTPKFFQGGVDLVYLGAMTEGLQLQILDIFRPYRREIINNIEDGTNFLFLGNAFEILGEYIEQDDGTKISGLDVFPFYTVQRMMERISSDFWGEKTLVDQSGREYVTEILGYQAQFTQHYLTCASFPDFCQVKYGFGHSKDKDREGIHYKNFIGTSVLGPLLLMNPEFTHNWAVQLTGDKDFKLALEDVIYPAYDKRLADYEHVFGKKLRQN